MADFPESPATREEIFLAKAAGQSVILPEPVSRRELFLAKIAGQNVVTPEPVSREEQYLNYIAEHGSGGGGSADIRQINPFPNNVISLVNVVGIRNISTSVVDNVGKIDGEEFSAGYEGFNIELSGLAKGNGYLLGYTFQTISGGFHPQGYTLGASLLQEPQQSYTESTTFKAFPRDYEAHVFLDAAIAQSDKMYLSVIMSGYNDSTVNVFCIKDIILYEIRHDILPGRIT